MRRKTGPSREVIDVVLARSGGNCEAMITPVCTFAGEQIHHRRPRGMGGSRRESTNMPSNLVALCASCHEFCESHRAWALERGLLCSQQEDPRVKPVLWRGRERFLDDVGGFERAVAA